MHDVGLLPNQLRPQPTQGWNCRGSRSQTAQPPKGRHPQRCELHPVVKLGPERSIAEKADERGLEPLSVQSIDKPDELRLGAADLEGSNQIGHPNRAARILSGYQAWTPPNRDARGSGDWSMNIRCHSSSISKSQSRYLKRSFPAR